MTSEQEATGKVTACEPCDIPRWARKLGKGLVNLQAQGRKFISTQHVTVSVTEHEDKESAAVSEVLASKRWTVDAFPSATVGRAYALESWGEQGWKHGYVVCDVGAVRVNLKYVLLVERLFPGCTWAAPASAILAPVQAIVDGVIVALVAGQEPGMIGGIVGEASS